MLLKEQNCPQRTWRKTEIPAGSSTLVSLGDGWLAEPPGAQLTLPGRELQTWLTQRADTPLCGDAPSSFSVFQKETRLALGIGLVETGGTNVLLGKAESTQNCPGHGADQNSCSSFLFVSPALLPNGRTVVWLLGLSPPWS